MDAVAGTSKKQPADSFSLLHLNQRSVDDMQTWVAPENAELKSGDVSIYDRIGTNLTRTDEIADNDIVVHQLNVSGINGVLEYQLDANGASNTTDAFLQAADTTGGFSFEINRTNVNLNTNEKTARLNNSNTVVIRDATNDTYFVAAELAPTEYQSGLPINDDTENDQITSDFALSDRSGLHTGDVTANYTITDRTVGINTTNGSVAVVSAPNQSITGTTTVAPGSNVEVILKSENTTTPSTHRAETTVSPNRTFRTVHDMSDYTADMSFSIDAVETTGNSADSADGQVNLAPTPTPTPTSTTTATPTPATTTTPTDRPTEEPSTETATTTASTNEQTDVDTTATDEQTLQSGGASTPGLVVVLTLVVVGMLLGIRQYI
jgi:hypothetical protein